MNCPNCDKRPVRKFYTFRLNGVSFKEKFKGYFRCRHCDTLLKQKQNSSFLPVYHKQFWIYYSILFVVVIGLTLGFLSLVNVYNLGAGVFLGGFAVIMIGMLGGIDELRARHGVIREADLEENVQSAKKLSKTGLLVFLGYTVMAVFGVIKLVYLLPELEIFQGKVASVILLFFTQLVITGLVIGGAIWILKHFSYEQESAGSS